MSLSPAENEILIARLRDSGAAALADYFVECRPRLYRMVELRMDARLLSRVDTDDILQEAFLEASRRLPEYLQRPEVPAYVWLRFLVRQHIAAAHRYHVGAEKRTVAREAHLDLQPLSVRLTISQVADGRSSPSSVVARQELHDRIATLLESLEKIDQEILVLRHLEELSNDESAAELGITAMAASKRYVRALRRLRASVDGACWELE